MFVPTPDPFVFVVLAVRPPLPRVNPLPVMRYGEPSSRFSAVTLNPVRSGSLS